MPKAEVLPPSISGIAKLNAVTLGKARGYEESLKELEDVLRRLGRFNVIGRGRFGARSEPDAAGSLLCFRISENGRTLSYREVLDYWETDGEFIDFYLSLFQTSGFSSYVWETPPITRQSWDKDFEFVLLNTPVSSGRPDLETYQQYYEPDNADAGVVVFDNLGGDAKLVVPSPLRSNANYCDLAHFFREAPATQQRALWRVVAKTAKARIGAAPLWISVAGGGIAWLHVRLDENPEILPPRAVPDSALTEMMALRPSATRPAPSAFTHLDPRWSSECEARAGPFLGIRTAAPAMKARGGA